MAWSDTPCIPGGNARKYWIKEYGDVSRNLMVCHYCDHPWCKNLNHCFLATQSENLQDMMNKGRQNYVGNRGACLGQKRSESHRRDMSVSAAGNKNASKLTAEDVIKIRTTPNRTNSEWAIELGVSYRVIRFARDRITWKDL